MNKDEEWTWIVDEARKVPVIRGATAVVYFDGGPNIQDQKANYEFWTMESKNCNPIFGRSLAGGNPAARFRELVEQRKENERYEKMWQCAQTATLIRNATKKEVNKWLRSHPVEAKYANREARIGMQIFEVKKVDGVYQLL